MRIPWRRLAWVLVAAIPLAVIGGLIWGATRDLSRYQARLTEQIRKVTGRELAAKVPLTVKIGRYPAMVAEGVTLSNAPWGSRPDLARVRKLTLFLDPIALLLGEIKIGRILLEGADILSNATRWATPTSRCCHLRTDRGRIRPKAVPCACARRRPSRGSA